MASAWSVLSRLRYLPHEESISNGLSTGRLFFRGFRQVGSKPRTEPVRNDVKRLFTRWRKSFEELSLPDLHFTKGSVDYNGGVMYYLHVIPSVVGPWPLGCNFIGSSGVAVGTVATRLKF